MNKLNRMLLRDLVQQRGQFIAAVTVVLLGIAMFSAVSGAQRNLAESLKSYYAQYAFMDYQADVAGISERYIKALEDIENVQQVMGRRCMDVGSNMKLLKKMTFRMLSVPDAEQPAINKLYLVSGKYFDRQDMYSCLINNSFAEYHGYQIGDQLTAIVNNVEYTFTIDGIVESPEFLYAIKDPSFPYPSPEDFGIMYLRETTFEKWMGDATSNEVIVRFNHPEDTYETVKAIERKLQLDGFVSGILRKDQISNYMIQDEIKQLKEFAVIFPTLFLSVASFIIYIMMKRIIKKQRTLIGVLKALGYTDFQILWHYLQIALAISALGSLGGAVLGNYLSQLMTRNYTQIYHLPVLKIEGHMALVGVAILFSSFFCIVSGLISARDVLLIEPAQAMRSEVPQSGRRIVLERFTVLWRPLSFGWKFSIRNLSRNRLRMIMTVMSIAFTVMFFMISLFFEDAIEHMIYYQFNLMQEQDYKMSLTTDVRASDIQELKQIKGITEVEPIYETAVRLEYKWYRENIELRGIGQDSMQLIMGLNKSFVELPETGIVIPESLAEKCDLHIGDEVLLKGSFEREIEKTVKVSAIVKQYTGSTCVMNLRYLQKLLERDLTANGALIQIHNADEEDALKALLEMSVIKSLEKKEDTLLKFNTLMDVFYSFIYTMLIFGAGMGFAIIFNSTLMSITDRQRELASLKVIGYTLKEIEGTLIRENVMQTLMAIIPGLVMGYLMCSLLAKAFSNDMMTIEVIITAKTYCISAVSIIVFVFVSQWASRKHVVDLDMIEVLKNREG